ncbi:MAG TPA: glycosyltransferase family 4 protein, partial [Chitinophagaceae bacterium]
LSTERFLARRTDALIAISAQQQTELTTQFRIASPGKFRVIPLGFELSRFNDKQEEKRVQFRAGFGLQDADIAIGIVGRLVPVKNHGLFLDALDYVLRKSSKKVVAFIIGDGDTRRAMEEKARSLGIVFTSGPGGPGEAALHFTSWRHDLDYIYAGLDIVAMTSLNEGTPVSLIEAQAAGRAVISTRVGGIADVVIENQTGLLSDVKDIEGFQKNMLTLVDDDSLRQRLAENGSAHVRGKFSVERLVADMSHLYHELLDRKKRHP